MPDVAHGLLSSIAAMQTIELNKIKTPKPQRRLPVPMTEASRKQKSPVTRQSVAIDVEDVNSSSTVIL